MIDTYKVGIYLRLSREDERLGESGSITTQRELLLNYIKENNLTFVSEYVDDGISGTTFDRDGFNKMIRDIESKKINMVITKDTSRLGRDHIEFGYYVERYFPENGVRYVAVTDGIDTSVSSSSNDMLVFKSAFNDMYVKDISNKMRASLYTKKKNGYFVGCYAPFGYRKNPDNIHELLIEEEESLVVKRIFSMMLEGYSVTNICNILTKEGIKTPSQFKNMKCGQKNLHIGVWNTRTVSDILKNPTYIGNLTQCRNKKINYKSKKRIHLKESEWIVKENSCPKIIDKEIFDVVQNMFKSNRNRMGNSLTDKLLLRGLVYCGDCHHTIGFRLQKQDTIKYGVVTRIYGNCNYWSKRKKLNVCTPHSVKYNDIEDIVFNSLKSIFKKYLNIDDMVSILKENNSSVNKTTDIQHEINSLEKSINFDLVKIDNIYNDKLDGVITLDMYKRMSDKLMLDISNKEDKRNSLKEKLLVISNKSLVNDDFYYNKVNDFINCKNITRDLIVSVIDKIEIDEENNINIYYKFSE